MFFFRVPSRCIGRAKTRLCSGQYEYRSKSRRRLTGAHSELESLRACDGSSLFGSAQQRTAPDLGPTAIALMNSRQIKHPTNAAAWTNRVMRPALKSIINSNFVGGHWQISDSTPRFGPRRFRHVLMTQIVYRRVETAEQPLKNLPIYRSPPEFWSLSHCTET
jgi:hypothetical protein